jgi:hypothetical protein
MSAWDLHDDRGEASGGNDGAWGAGGTEDERTRTAMAQGAIDAGRGREEPRGRRVEYHPVTCTLRFAVLVT